jgi:hypothetical protein
VGWGKSRGAGAIVMPWYFGRDRATLPSMTCGAAKSRPPSPAYSPDLNPIEEAFSKLKALLHRAGARTREALTDAIRATLRAITPQDARGWYAHCGYPLQDQDL